MRCPVGQLVFTEANVEGWIIDMDTHVLLDGPGDVMCLPAYNGEAVHIDGVSCGLVVLVDEGGGSEVLF